MVPELSSSLTILNKYSKLLLLDTQWLSGQGLLGQNSCSLDQTPYGPVTESRLN